MTRLRIVYRKYVRSSSVNEVVALENLQPYLRFTIYTRSGAIRDSLSVSNTKLRAII